MGLPLYLAQTRAEFTACSLLPNHFAWMACHFSPYGTGLCGLPPVLPADAMVILNDRIPPNRHDVAYILDQLAQINCGCFLLDFQQEGNAEIEALTRAILEAESRPVGVSPQYGQGLDCPVFLPPVPPDVLPEAHIAPWAGREIWLDAATEAVAVTVDARGSHREQASLADSQPLPFTHDALCCRYGTKLFSDRAVFTLQRTSEELPQLLEKAEALGVTAAISLYQEIKKLPV